MKNFLKKISATLAILAILGASTASAGVSNRDTQLVINGNFNDTNITYSVGSGGWTTFSTALGSSVIDDPDRVGNKILEIVPDSSSSCVYQTVSGMTTGGTYRVRGRAKTLPTGGVPRIYMNGEYVWIGESSGVTTDWQYFDFNITTSSLNYIRLYSFTSSGGKVYFDDISITQYYGKIENRDTQLVVDGNMEAIGTTAWTANGATLTKVADGVIGQAMMVERTGGNAIATQPILTGGETYRFRGYCKAGIGGLCRVFNGSTLLKSASSTTEYTYLDFVFTAGSSSLSLYGGANIGHTAYYDEISVTRYYGKVENRELNVVADGNMEATGTAGYAVHNSAVLTKEAGAGNTTGSQVLRVAYGGVGLYYATISGLTTTASYRARGQYRSDGVVHPRVVFGGSTQSIGTASTAWQSFDIVGIPSNGIFYLGAPVSSGWVEFDNVSITRVY